MLNEELWKLLLIYKTGFVIKGKEEHLKESHRDSWNK